MVGRVVDLGRSGSGVGKKLDVTGSQGLSKN